MTTPTLTRKATPWPERQTAHVAEAKWRAGQLAAMLDAAAIMRVRTLSLVAGPYADQRPNRDWMLAPSRAGWSISNYLGDPPRATYRNADGCAVDVVTTAPWFGECLDKPAIDHTWHLLRGLVRGQFDAGATLMSTPAGTGLDLLRRSLPREGAYPVAPADLLTLMHANGGQGRMEFLPTTTDTSDLTWMDARWQYAVSVFNLPRGQMRYEHTHEVLAHAPAFYFCGWKAPADWPFPLGLLPELTGEEGHRFYYPIDRAWHTGWITGVELEFAREEGWDVHVSERLCWDMTTPDPARTWGTKLRTMRQHTRDPLAQDAIRHILLDGIGAWFRQARRELHITPRAQAESLPEDAYGIKLIDDAVEWFRDGTLPKALRDMQHPEWSWTVWGRSRVRLLRAVLRYVREVPDGEVVALRSDAFVCTRDPGWPDDGHVGTFRRKRHLEAAQVPHDETAYRALLAGEEDE